jgi:hypothetical protein
MLSFDSKYNRQLIDATFLQDKHNNINAVFLNIFNNVLKYIVYAYDVSKLEQRRCSSNLSPAKTYIKHNIF